MSQTLLLSDLHLSKHTPDFNRIFINQLFTWQNSYDAIYLLGDIFDQWIGDDVIEYFAQEIILSLKQFSTYKPLYLMHGNRDFLIGETFLKLSGAILLADPHLANIYGKYYILSHGDILCTDDVKYQNFRRKTRSPDWQKKILRQPKWYRKFLAQSIRTFSFYLGKTKNQQNISDATISGVNNLKNLFLQYPHADIIHGHTHKPNIHRHNYMNNNQIYSFTRYVLPDWRPNLHGALSINDKHHINDIYF